MLEKERLTIYIGGIPLGIKGELGEETKEFIRSFGFMEREALGPGLFLKIIFVKQGKKSRSKRNPFNFDFLFKRFPFERDAVENFNRLIASWKETLLGLNKKDVKNMMIYPQEESLFFFDPEDREAFLFLNQKIKEDLIPLNILEAIRILLSVSILRFNGIFLHACGMVKDLAGSVFLGLPNSGKTTIAKLAEKEALILSDDGVIVKGYRHGYEVFGTPYSGFYRDLERGYPLKKIFFIHKYRETFTRPLSPAKASALILLHHIPYFRFFPQRSAKRAFTLVTEICKAIPSYELYFNKSRDFLRWV